MTALKDMPISFPGLFGEWAWNPDPIAVHIGHGIYWYGIILAFAMLCGVWLSMRNAGRCGLEEDNILDLALVAAPCCIIGSRIYYVVFNLELYRNASGGIDFGRAVAVWDGGIAIYGTVIAGVLVALAYARFRQIPFGALGDAAVPGLMLGQAVGRWANLVNREAFGALTDLPWRMRLWTSATESIEVHPTFFYESLWNAIGLAVMLKFVFPRRRFDGQNTCFYFLWYGFGRFWIEGLRTDSLYLFGWTFFGTPVRISQAFGLLTACAAAVVLYRQLVMRHASAADLYVNRPGFDTDQEEHPAASGRETAFRREKKTAADENHETRQEGSTMPEREPAVRMNGKAVAGQIKTGVRAEAAELPRKACLAVILVGEDPASQTYVSGKERDCRECGILSRTCRLSADATQDNLLDLIDVLNDDPAVDGILVQLPLPEHIDAAAVLEAIAPDKDVDCFHPYNVGKLYTGSPEFLPCTPAGVMALLRTYQIPIAGKRCVVLGRSNIVGKPMAALLTAANGTVTVCHSRTEKLAEITRTADILVSAVGKAGFVTADMVKEDAAVIDVGINRDGQGRLCGDVDYDAVEYRAGWISPVPGGVGLLTRAMLMENILYAAKRHLHLQ